MSGKDVEMIRESRIIAGDNMRVHLFPVRRLPGAGRGIKRKPSSEAQTKYNAKMAAHKISDRLNANFTPGDSSVYLTYTVTPVSVEAAENEMRLFIRKVRYLHQKRAETPLKYIYVTEVGKKSGRIHHHIVISSSLSRYELEEIWEGARGHGRARAEKLYFGPDGLDGLANYIIKSPETRRRWNCSKGLIQPQPIKRDGYISAADTAYIARVGEGARREIERKYPGYYLRGVERPAMPEPDAAGNLPPYIPELFVTLYLYRKDAVYFDAQKAHETLDAAGTATWKREDPAGKRTGRKNKKLKEARDV